MPHACVEALYTTAHTDGAVQLQRSLQLQAGQGIVGDRYYQPQQSLAIGTASLRKHDLTLISSEALEAFNERFGLNIPLGDFRRNIITRGIDLNALVGKRFRVGSVLCEGVEWCEPCSKLARMVSRLVLPHLVHQGGLRAAIIEGGEVRPGDSIDVLAA